jgi:lipopolysaccharide export system protein LptA
MIGTIRFGAAAFGMALLLTAIPAAAANPEKDPVQITSDKMVVDDAQHLATFTGKVVVTKTDLTVWAPKVVVVYGADGPSSINSFIATGGVRIKTPDQDATGQRADYDPNAKTLKLSGDVMVINATGTVGSPDLVLDLVTNKTVFTGKGKNGRVTGVFTPK